MYQYQELTLFSLFSEYNDLSNGEIAGLEAAVAEAFALKTKK
jgi:hypothetical protein